MAIRALIHLPRIDLRSDRGEALFAAGLTSGWERDAEVFRVRSYGQMAELIGLPSEAFVAPGVLRMAALGFEPPAEFTQFCLNFLSLDDGVVGPFDVGATEEELAEIVKLAPKLDTRALTFCKGEGKRHALVWESRGEAIVSAVPAILGKELSAVMPEGDGDKLLRRYIEDSVDLLSELEFNRRRAEEGRPKINLFWPWGPGQRPTLPNLPLVRGEPGWVISESLAMQGLARLVGYRHSARQNLSFRRMRTEIERGLPTWVVPQTPADPDEFAWWLRQLRDEVLQPLRELEGAVRLTLTAFDGEGLALRYDSENSAPGRLPFRADVLEESRASVTDLADLRP